MKSYLAKIIAEPAEKARILETLVLNRDAWNECSKSLFEKKTSSLKILHSRVYKTLRAQFPELPSQIVIKAEQDCLSAFRSIKSNKQKIKAAPVKKKLSYQLDDRIHTLKNDVLSLTATGGKRVKVKILLYPRLIEAMKLGIRAPKLFERKGELWLSIPCITPAPQIVENGILGVDLGIKRAAATSEGAFISRKDFNRKLRIFSFNKRKLQAKKTRSAKRKLRKMSRRHYNMSRDFTHCCVNKVLKTQANIIAIEWLRSLKNKSRGKYMNRLLSQWAYGEFRRILEYKAQILGKRVVTVNPAFTSQNDWRGVPKGKRVGCRYYASDGVVLDADWNASMNIAKLAQQKLNVSGIPISHCEVLDGQAQVIAPNVKLGETSGGSAVFGFVHVLQAPE